MWMKQIQRFGSGCGIEIRGEDLHVTAVRSRPKGVSVAGRTALEGFRGRPPEEWGAEYARFLAGLGLSHLSATVSLPRGDVIVRLIHLPPVKRRDELAAAVAYQLESLHPYEPDEIYHSFAPLQEAAEGMTQLPVAVIIAEKAKVDGYADLFEQAGIAVESFTVNAGAFFAGLRVRWDAPPKPFLLANFYDGKLEVYGEGESRSLFSAEFDLEAMPAARALQLAAADLRLQETEPGSLVVCGRDGEGEQGDEETAPGLLERKAAAELLPAPVSAPEGFDLERDAASLAVGLEAACPRLGWRANLLPPERRKGNARWMYVPTAVLSALLLVLAVMFLVRPIFQDRAYAQALAEEISRLQERTAAVDRIERETQERARRAALLRALDRRVRQDLAIISELSRLLPETAWLQQLELEDEGARMTGEAQTAAPLLEIVNRSENVRDAEFLTSLSPVEGGQRFQIGAQRRQSLEHAPLPRPGSEQETLEEQERSGPDSGSATLETLSGAPVTPAEEESP